MQLSKLFLMWSSTLFLPWSLLQIIVLIILAIFENVPAIVDTLSAKLLLTQGQQSRMAEKNTFQFGSPEHQAWGLKYLKTLTN